MKIKIFEQMSNRKRKTQNQYSQINSKKKS